jgi:hypothetical protein
MFFAGGSLMTMEEAFTLLRNTRALIDDTDERNKALLYAGKIAGIRAEQISGDSMYPTPSGKPLALWYDRTSKKGIAFKSKFKSQKQQGKVFALIAEGAIPYARTGRLGASMTSDAYVIDDGVAVRVGTNRPGAAYVIGDDEEQSAYHKGTWPQLQTNVNAHIVDITDTFGDALINYIRGYLSGGK